MLRCDDGPVEETLGGGNMEPVVRVGDTVRRMTGAWTPAVHALLWALEAAGVRGVPRVLGRDDAGREVLTFVDGDVLAHQDADVLWRHDVLTSAVRLLRAIHDAGAHLAGDESLVWRAPRHEPAEVVCHNDFATYNLLVRDGRLSGAIDFDFASPGPRVWDVAYLAYRLVPIAEDAPSADGLDRDARLRALIEAYGESWAPAHIMRVTAERLDELASFTRDRARETGRTDFLDHAGMYERDAAALRARRS